jgi:TolB-like protein
VDDASLLRFADCELDAGRFELRRGGAPVAVEPQVFELIVHLARNPGRLVTKDELIEKVWGGRIVSDAALASRIKSARRALGDDGASQRLIKTVHGRGVRFLGELAAAAPAGGGAPAGADDRAEQQAAASAPSTPEIPSVAVLRFHVPSEDPAHVAIAAGITEDLTTHLARVPGFFVIARYSTQGYDPASVDPRNVAGELGVRYVVEGSVRPVEAGLRVHARLVDAVAGGVQIWGGQFDAPADRAFAVEAITLAIIGKLEIPPGRGLGRVDADAARPRHADRQGLE